MLRPLTALLFNISLVNVLALTACGPKALPAAALPAAPTAFRAAGLPADVLVTEPQGGGPHPVLVIAPAKEYKMDGPIFVALADGAARLGYRVVRFNWTFVTQKGQPSADLSAENADIDAVMAKFAQPGQPLVLAAKSFGSRAAMRGAFKRASALLLMTPNSNSQATFEQTYTPLLGYPKPLHVVISADDPYGDLKQLYAAVPKLGPKVTLDVLPAGDHNFKVEGPNSARNEAAALDSSLNFLAFQR
jgi:predicted alpha/beta-hydrolase family hydrolase